MKSMNIEEIRTVVRGWRLSEGKDLGACGVSIDSRTAEAGDVFVAVAGERFDGHDFLSEAAAAGCVAAVVERDRPLSDEDLAAFPGGAIGVMDTIRALGDLAGRNRQIVGADVVAITGSNGKTTVKEMVHHILSSRLGGRCSPRSYNNHIGVPLTLLGAEPGDDYIVCEIGANAPGEIANLGRIAQPDVAVVTSVAASHLEGFRNVERVAAEKASLLGALRAGGMAVVFRDNELLRKSVGAYTSRVVWFGESEGSVLRLTGREANGRTQRIELNGRLSFELPLAGKHNAMNALAAIAVAQRFGMQPEESGEAMRDFQGVAMRLQWIDAGDRMIINDAYNANPASMAAAAGVLAGCKGRRILIAGDMLELGPDAADLHHQTGRELGETGLELIVGVGELGQLIAEGAAGAGATAEAMVDMDEALQRVPEMIGAGDVVLVKGSRGMRMERLVDHLVADGSDPAGKDGDT
ncbi:MAG: UDP-N-acetylmuramoyl-tripeptide--D-alanyl-D-alanine ligase [Phycisphaerae bacterium]